MLVIERSVGNAVLATVSGRIDISNAGAFGESLSAALANANSALILDLSGVDYISSAGLRSLVIALKSSQAQGKAFGLAALQPLLLDIFAVSRFNIVFQLFSTVREAFSKLAPFALEELDRR